MFGHRLGDGLCDAVRVQVQVGRQALQIKMIPLVQPFQRQNLVRQRTAGNQQHAALMAWR